MKENFRYGRNEYEFELPADTIIYKSAFELPEWPGYEQVQKSVNQTVGSENLRKLITKKRDGKVVVVVSDITRPIKYTAILPALFEELHQSGISRKEIVILIATGMHRPSTEKERVEMMGKEIAERYLVVDHKAENENELVKIEGQSRGGADVFLNKHYVNAGFRIVTGLVEPHFMAGFSGGRKAVCPGLVSLSAVKNFHGYDFLSDTGARNGNLENNPCHEESVSIEKLCPADFSIHIVQDNLKNINKVFSGDITKAHQAAVEYVKKACCREVKEHADLVLTSCGGYPLDATFYQCVKGFVSCLPAVRTKGEIIAFGSCSEGTGSMEYGDTMKKYAGRHNEFLEHIKKSDIVVKDQWQFQMHARALSKISKQNLYFFTSGITKEELKMFSVNPQSVNEAQIQPFIQDIIKVYARMGKKIAAFPEGPYCAPV